MVDFKNMSPYELGLTYSKEAIPILIEYLKFGSKNEKRLAASAVSKLAPHFKAECNQAIPALIECIKLSDQPQTRQYALKTLAKLNLEDQHLEDLRKVQESDEKAYNRNIAYSILSKYFILDRSKNIITNIKKPKSTINKMPKNFVLAEVNLKRRVDLSRLDLSTEIDDSYLIEYLNASIKEVLKGRENKIITMRYGLEGEKPCTLQQIGSKFNLSRERIRQIADKSIMKILRKGKKQIKKGDIDCPCAGLLLYFQRIIRPEEEEAMNRAADYVEQSLSYLSQDVASKLVIYLTFQGIKISKQFVSILKNILKNRKEVRKAEIRKEILREKFLKFIAYVKWPEKIQLLTQKSIENIRNQRDVSDDGIGNSGKFFSRKMEREVQYESQLEFNFFYRLEKMSEVIFFQEQPFVVPYEIDGKNRNYYPDVLFVLEDGRGVVVEIKPTFMMPIEINLIKFNALEKFCAEKGLGLLFTDGRKSIQEVCQTDINREFEESILNALNNGSITGYQYRKIRDKYNLSKFELLALILKNGLSWNLKPFKLRKSRKELRIGCQ